LLFRPNGSGAEVSWSEKLLAPVRVLRGVFGSIVNGMPAPFPELSVPNIGGAMFRSLNRFRGRRHA
jgi:hypothetical protein